MAGREPTLLPEALDLNNLVSLPPEKQSLTVLQWLADCESFLVQATPDLVSKQQQAVQQAVINLLSLPTPPIGRVLRSSLGRCFHLLFEKGDRRVLFDTASTLIQKVALVRADKEAKQKHATIYALGAVLGVAGDSILQLIPEAVSTLIKTIRTSSLEAGIRALALESLKKTISKPGQVKDEAVIKDLNRISRSGLGDKHWIIQIRAAELLEQIIALFNLANSQSDLESIKSAVVQTMDTSSKRLRLVSSNALASLFLSVRADKQGDVLADTQSPEPKRKRPTSSIKGEEEEPDGRASPVPSKAATIPPFRIDFREILRHFSTLYARSSSKHVRSGVIQTYSIVLKRLGGEFAKLNYSTIVEHLLSEVSTHPLVITDRYRLIEARSHIQFLLGHVIRRLLLDEPGKMTAIRVLTQLLDQKNPTKGSKAEGLPTDATISAITELSGLVQDLGSAVSFEQDVLVETFKKYVQHPNSAVQSVASWGLRLFVLAVPSQFEPLLSWSKSEMEKHLALLGESNTSNTRVPLGLAQSFAVLVQASGYRPMYFANDNVNELWKIANTQLQLSAKSDLRSSQVQIQIAWNLIGALMSVGTPFIKSRVSQLLLLWHNALPRPLSREKMATSNIAELHYLLHVRDRALAALSLFLQYNMKILTHDLSTRIHAMLSDTAVFVGRLPATPVTDDARVLSSHSQLVDIAVRVKMRVFKCYCQLVLQDFRKFASPEILMNAIAVFVEADPLISKFISAKSPVSSSFESLNLISDNFAFGVTSYQSSRPVNFTDDENCSAKRDSDPEILDQMIGLSVLGGLENDVSQIYSHGGQITEMPLPVPSATALVDSAIDLFSLMVFDQPIKIQESAFAQIAASFGESLLTRNAARKAAITKNITIAISKALNGLNNRLSREIGQNARVKTLLLDILKSFIVDSDCSVRKIAGDALGRVCSNLEDVEVGKQVKFLTDSVISNREPNSRAGFAFALGSILYHLGGMAAGIHLRNVLGLLLSLANDSHPVVHFWALEALEKCIESSGLGFSPHVSSCLVILARLILSDLFDPEDVAAALSNAALDVSTLPSLTRCIDSILNVLGPDLTSSKKSKVLICCLVNELDLDSDPLVSTEAIRCMQHLELFAPDSIDHVRYVHRLEINLSSDSQRVRHISSEALYALVRKDVNKVFQLSQSSLSDQLWSSVYAHGCMSKEIEEIIYSWLDQTALKDVKQWIGLCLKLLTHAGQRDLIKEEAKTETLAPEQPEFIDEAAAFSAQSTTKAHTQETHPLYFSWQAISFALGCLRRVVQLNLKTLSVDSSTDPLILCVGDLIRAAFTASTSIVVEIRLGGLTLLHELIKGLAECVDPDFPESTLLEQYQAQIASALTPAFAADSSPDIAAEAISICAEFISSDIVKDVDHLGRLLKILVAGLVNIDDESFIGELKIPNMNARLMVKVAVLSAWAELQIQSTAKPYLSDIVSQHLERLTAMWLEALTAYAKVQFEPEAGDGNVIDEMILDSQSGSSKDFLLQVYRPCWLQIMHAIATLIEMESEVVFSALDSNFSELPPGGTDQANYRDEPVAFFFIIYGLCFQTLLKMINRDDSESKRTIPLVLDALKKFLRPSISGNAVYKGFVFAETTDLLDRLVLMENAEIQISVVQIASSLAKYHPHAVNGRQHSRRLTNGNTDSNRDEAISDEIEQLLDLVHILILALNKKIHATGGTREATRGLDSNLAAPALIYLIEMTDLFPPVVRVDLFGGIFSIYEKLLEQDAVFANSAKLLLAPYKSFCQILREYLIQDGSVAAKIINSVRHLTSKLINRLDNLGPSQFQEYEAGCFLVTVSFTSVPDAFLRDLRLFSRFSSLLASGLLAAKMSTCAMKCFRALSTSELELPRRWIYTIFADLLPHVTSSPGSNYESARLAMGILIEFVEKRPRQEASGWMALLLPAIGSATEAATKDSERETAAVEAVLRLASLNPSSFRLVLSKMDGEEKDYLTKVLREALVEKQKVEVEVHTQPTISLTLDFGSVE